MQVQINFHEGAIIGRREEQQDDKTNLIINARHRLYVLADGMGGQKGGRLASKVVCAAVREYFVQHPDITNPEAALQLAAQHANHALSEVLRSQPELNGMGTTLVAVIMDEASNGFSYLSIGDSPLYLYRQGYLVRINANHAYAEELKQQVARGELSEEEAENHPQRHGITSAVMGKVIEKMDISSGVLRQGELLLLASDGIQVLSDTAQGEISQRLKQAAGNLEQAVQLLLQAVEAKNDPYQDNTTLVLVRPAEPTATAPTQTVAPPTQASQVASDVMQSEELPSKSKQTLLYSVIAVLASTIVLLVVLMFTKAIPPEPSEPSEPLSVPAQNEPQYRAEQPQVDDVTIPSELFNNENGPTPTGEIQPHEQKTVLADDNKTQYEQANGIATGEPALEGASEKGETTSNGSTETERKNAPNL